MWYHFCHILFIKAVTKFCPGSRGGKIDSSSWWGSDRVNGTRYTAVSISGKYKLPHTLSPSQMYLSNSQEGQVQIWNHSTVVQGESASGHCPHALFSLPRSAILHSQGPPVLVFGHSCPQVLALFMSPTNKHPPAVPQALGHTTAV